MYTGRLLSTSKKTKKSDNAGLGYLSKILYLAPHKLSGHNVCPHASAGCISACLNKSGHGFFPSVQKARVEKTKMFFEHREEFIVRLKKEVTNFLILCNRKGLKPAIRLNGTSDLPWERLIPDLFSSFPDVVWYDYTKNPRRMKAFCNGEFPPNYHLTFSRSESNDEAVKEVLAAGGNVSVVFHTSLPTRFMRRKVQNGDLTDLRFLDRPGIIGLTAKGIGRSDKSGFVVNHNGN